MPDQWYFARQGKKNGPFSLQQLQQLTASGLLQPVDMVLQEGTKTWVPVSSINELVAMPIAVPVLPAEVPVALAPAAEEESRGHAQLSADEKLTKRIGITSPTGQLLVVAAFPAAVGVVAAFLFGIIPGMVFSLVLYMLAAVPAGVGASLGAGRTEGPVFGLKTWLYWYDLTVGVGFLAVELVVLPVLLGAGGVCVSILPVVGVAAYIFNGFRLKCNSCKMWWAGVRLNREALGSSQHFKTVERDIKNPQGEVVGKIDQQVQYTLFHYRDYYKCRHCGHGWHLDSSKE